MAPLTIRSPGARIIDLLAVSVLAIMALNVLRSASGIDAVPWQDLGPLGLRDVLHLAFPVMIRLALIVALAWRYRGEPRRLPAWAWLTALPVALAGSAVFAFVESRETPFAPPPLEAGPGREVPLGFVAYALVDVLLLAPFAEELLFREWLPRAIPFFVGLVPNAALFALLHGWEGGVASAATQMAVLFLAGCLFWLARRVTGNVYYAVAVHALGNLLSFVR